MSLVVNPYAYFTDTNGDALNGYLYIGEAGKNAENYPIAIYYDNLLTTPAPNPLTVSAGYIYNGGTIAQIYASEDYSVVARKTDGSLVFSKSETYGMINGAVATVEDLKGAIAPYNNYALNVLGYSEAGDGGGGLFYYDANSTEDDNGGTIIEPTSGSGRWKRSYDYVLLEYFGVESPDYVLDSNWTWDATVDKSTANLGTIIDPSVALDEQGTGSGLGCMIRQYSGAVNIKWFGAVGDGVTDDTVALQNALDSEQNGGSVFIPNSRYKITDTLVINQQSLTVVGESSSLYSGTTTLLIWGGDALATNQMIKVSDTWHSSIFIKSISFVGGYDNISNIKDNGSGGYTSSITDNGQIGIELRKSIDNCFIQECTFYGFKTAIDLYEDPKTNWIINIQNCSIKSCYLGINSNANALNISNTYIYECGIWATVQSANFIGCTTQNGGIGKDIGISASGKLTLKNHYFEGNSNQIKLLSGGSVTTDGVSFGFAQAISGSNECHIGWDSGALDVQLINVSSVFSRLTISDISLLRTFNFSGNGLIDKAYIFGNNKYPTASNTQNYLTESTRTNLKYIGNNSLYYPLAIQQGVNYKVEVEGLFYSGLSGSSWFLVEISGINSSGAAIDARILVRGNGSGTGTFTTISSTGLDVTSLAVTVSSYTFILSGFKVAGGTSYYGSIGVTVKTGGFKWAYTPITISQA